MEEERQSQEDNETISVAPPCPESSQEEVPLIHHRRVAWLFVLGSVDKVSMPDFP